MALTDRVREVAAGTLEVHRREGSRAAAKSVMDKLLWLCLAAPRTVDEFRTDRRYGIHSQSLKQLFYRALPTGENPYQPTSAAVFRRALGQLTLDPSQCTFVDIGSGKGTALVLAREAGFDRLVGVEYQRELVDTARRNITDAEFVVGDARDFILPSGPVFLYLFNPFDERILRTFLYNVVSQRSESSRDVYLLYVNPVHLSVLAEYPAFRPVGGQRDWSAFQMI